MSVEQNKNLVTKMFAVSETDNMDLFSQFIDENYTEGYLYHDPSVSPSELDRVGLKKAILEFRSAAKNFHMIMSDMFGEDDMVASRYVSSYVDENGTSRSYWNLNILRFEGDKIAEEWNIPAPLA